jgi:hypothetical protein
MKTIPSNLIDPLNQFLINLNKAIELYWVESKFTHSKAPQVRVERVGPKFAKLTKYEERNGVYSPASVYCFLDVTTGGLWKGTWKAPIAGGLRANLSDANLLEKMDLHGPCYLRGGGAFNTIAVQLAHSTI